MECNLIKVLVVDDDETMRLLLSTLLTMENYQVQTISPINVKQLHQELQSFSPDIIILDNYLKHLNGMKILEELRSSRNYDNIKFIMTSGEDLSVHAIKVGASHFLLKPYMPSELIEYLHMLSS